ncbi:MAG TPA: hypothetical protein VG265_13190 [Gaiellaceae bacterium]|jgi:capsular polysaccharide biosynthesis protein|nr:hypothetical protein [Gaiellaceae bacterium]
MSAVHDPGAEREIDLKKWRDAAFSYWWVAAAGLVAGIVLGSLYSLSGGTSYSASALIARGQAFNPGGTTSVLGYLSSPAAIQAYATEPTTIDIVAARTGITPGQLAGHVSTSTVGDTGTAAASATNTNSILIQISVTLNKPKKAEDAANAFASIITKLTTSSYVTASLAIYQRRDASFTSRIKSLTQQIASLNDVLAHTKLAPLDKLVLVSEQEQAQASLGQTLDSQSTNQQQLILARDVEQTKLIQQATRAQKSQARSRRNSVLFGALIGLLLGVIVAVYLGLRGPRPAAF